MVVISYYVSKMYHTELVAPYHVWYEKLAK